MCVQWWAASVVAKCVALYFWITAAPLCWFGNKVGWFWLSGVKNHDEHQKKSATRYVSTRATYLPLSTSYRAAKPVRGGLDRQRGCAVEHACWDCVSIVCQSVVRVCTVCCVRCVRGVRCMLYTACSNDHVVVFTGCRGKRSTLASIRYPPSSWR